MPTIYNHSHHFNADNYQQHNLEKYNSILQDGGLESIKAFACAEPSDIVQLDPRLRDQQPYLQEGLESAGIETTENIIWDVSADVLREFDDHDLSVYRFCAAINAARPNPKRLKATVDANNKNTFVMHCQENNHPTPHNYLVSRGRPAYIVQVNFPSYVKAANSSSGVSIYRVKTQDELDVFTQQVGEEYQIQEEVHDYLSFLNVQYQARAGAVGHLATSEQILNGFSHAGNRHPADYNPQYLTDRLAKELADQGLEDVFAFDVAVAPTGFSIIECNARWNGATYPTKVANKLGIEQWTACTLDTNLDHPKELDLGEIIYNKKQRFGALVISFAFKSASHKVSLLLAGSPEEQDELRTEVAERLKAPALAS